MSPKANKVDVMSDCDTVHARKQNSRIAAARTAAAAPAAAAAAAAFKLSKRIAAYQQISTG